MESAESLFERLSTTDECDAIEAKRGSEIGRSVLETVCAMSNEPHLGGGTILLGIERDSKSLFWPTYHVSGVSDPDKLQADLATQCATVFNVPVRPRIKSEKLGEKIVLVVFVPEVAPTDKPVYFKKEHLPQGAFRRIGGTDQKCTEDDLIALYHARQVRTFDSEVLQDTTIDDADPIAIDKYRRLRREEKSDATEVSLPTDQLLSALGCAAVSQGRLSLTVAGVLIFGTASALKRYFPMTRVDYIRVPGNEWVPNPEAQYHALPIHKPLIDTVYSARDIVLDDVPKGFGMNADDFQRKDKLLIPARVIREAIVNAVIHRCYRSRGTVQIIRYQNRLEIINPGYSLKAVERMLEPGTEPRNPSIADIIRGVGLAETMGLGVKFMSDKMREVGLEPPSIESDRTGNKFSTRLLFHHFLSDDDVRWLSHFQHLRLNDADRRALIFAREVRAVDNATYRDFGTADTLTASHRLRYMCDSGLLERKGGGAQTYYIPTDKLLNPTGFKKNPTGNGGDPTGKNSPTDAIGTSRYEARDDWEAAEQPIEPPPLNIQKLLDALPQRAGPKRMATVILSLCAWRDLKASEIAAYCKRNAQHLRQTHIASLLEDGLLSLTDNPSSPNLRYKT